MFLQNFMKNITKLTLFIHTQNFYNSAPLGFEFISADCHLQMAETLGRCDWVTHTKCLAGVEM